MIKQLIILIMCLFMLNTVFATEPIVYYHVDNIINISVPCYNNGAYCSNLATCNITILNPISEKYVDNKLMVNNGAYQSYLINPTLLGDYQTYIMCTDGGESNYNNFIFQVNNIGQRIENMLPMLLFYFFLIIIIGILTAFTLSHKSPMILPLMLALSLLFSWLFFYIYMHTISLNAIYYAIYWFFNIISIGIFFITLWYGTMLIIDNFSSYGKRKKGFNDNF